MEGRLRVVHFWPRHGERLARFMAALGSDTHRRSGRGPLQGSTAEEAATPRARRPTPRPGPYP